MAKSSSRSISSALKDESVVSSISRGPSYNELGGLKSDPWIVNSSKSSSNSISSLLSMVVVSSIETSSFAFSTIKSSSIVLSSWQVFPILN